MKIINPLFVIVFLLLTFSCTSDDEALEPLSLVDCELEFPTDPSELLIGICSSGAEVASQDEILFYGSKFTGRSHPDDLEIVWTVSTGNMEIVNVESVVFDGVRQSVAEIKFASDFSGGIINVKGIDANSTESAAMNLPIELRN